MKTLNIELEDSEFIKLKKVKKSKGLTWKGILLLILELVNGGSEKRE